MTLLISLLLVIPILWILFSPIILKIDTKEEIYWLRWWGVASIQLKTLADVPVLRLQIWFWKKDFHLLDALLKREKSRKNTTAKRRKKEKKKNWKGIGLKVLRSFTVKRFDLKLDTDDYVLNSYLYPLAYVLGSRKWRVGINYNGESSLQLQIENRLIRLLKAVLL